ncbi:CHAT domain-containing protein [Argonema antarcticum]|uniref:CHAT domain-containing protein n=1 Tax=Argonema antarcticum TaxID=2942763 RepID=UPI00201339A2|nr:CHAT domain-containing protein [Argonema antarcticum A004/B2]
MLSIEQKGNQKAADFLIALVHQLTKVLGLPSNDKKGKTAEHKRTGEEETLEEYFNFLIKVLDADLKSGGDKSIVYPLLDTNLNKLNDKFAKVLQAWVKATFPELEIEQCRVNAQAIFIFCSLIQQFPKGNRASNLEIAIAGCEIVLTVYTRNTFPKDWAQTQNNLGNAYLYRIRGERAENLEQAIGCYEKALQVHTRKQFPQDWARLQNNLGNAYIYRIKGERAQNLEQAIACSKRALQIRTRKVLPKDWAATQNNLGNAYTERILSSQTDNLNQAIIHYENALQVYTVETYPEQWAMLQNNLGTASSNYTIDRGKKLEKSIACFKRALFIYTQKAFSKDWAMLQNNLGTAYRGRLRKERAKNLEKAINCFENALQVYTFEAYPEQWAMTQNNRGITYKNRIYGEPAENLKRSVACYELALLVYTPEAFPQKHAQILLNLGLTYKAARQFTNAYTVFADAIETVENLRHEIISGNNVKQKLAEEWNQLYRSMVEVCLEMGTTEPRYKAQALEYVERSKTRNLAELIATRNQNLEFKGNISFEEIQKLLPDSHTVIIEWYVLAETFLTFIITPHTHYVWQSHSEHLEALETWAKKYLDAYYGQKDSWKITLASRLRQLAKILHIDDIVSLVPDTYNQVILIPHRGLHIFPLHALPLATGNYFVDRFHRGVRYAPSSRLLQLSLSQERPDFNCLFTIENPNSNLRFANLEIRAISHYFRSKCTLIQEQATINALYQSPSAEDLCSAHCVHFSCHGFFDQKEPLESYLELPPAFLTLGDIFELDLSQCRLVTLSACETGLIDFISISDEYIGLPSGFLYAGSPSVVSSLWRVNDLSTALLMIRFYENLGDPQAPTVAIALNQAQCWLRDVKKKDLLNWINQLSLKSPERREVISFIQKLPTKPFESPYYWAAFCAIGQ